MKVTRSRLPSGPWYCAIFIKPSGGYLFLYPGSMRRMFLLAIGDDPNLPALPNGPDDAQRVPHPCFTPKAANGAGIAPVNLLDEVGELVAKVELVNGRAPGFIDEIARNPHQRIHP